MIIYNPTWLANLEVQEQTARDLNRGHLSAEEFKAVALAYPVGFYSPNNFVRAGLFILTSVIASFSAGILALFTIGMRESNANVLCIIMGLAASAVLHTVVKQKHHFRSGADDALLWIAGGSIASAFFLFTEHSFDQYNDVVRVYVSSAFIMVLSGYLTLRYADRLMAFVCLAAFLLLTASAWCHLIPFGTATLPFLMMALTAATYFVAHQLKKQPYAANYAACLEFIEVLGLLICYLAGNFYVVKQLGAQLHAADSATYQVPLPYFFWSWTILMPFLYITAGIRRKDSLLIRSGLVLIAAAAFTFRNYYHLMALETILVLCGILFLLIAYLLIRYLKMPRGGFTYEDLQEKNLADHLKIESLLVTAMPTTGVTPPADRFGGGNFGGGGSSSDF